MVGWDNWSDSPPIFMTLIPGSSPNYEWFPWSICNGCGRESLPFRTPCSVPFGDLLMLQLMRPVLLAIYIFLDFSPWIPLGIFSILLTSFLKPLNGSKRNLTGSKVSTFSTKFVFRAGRKTKMAAPASDWLRHFGPFLWNYWTEVDKTWKKARSQRPLPSLLLTCLELERLSLKCEIPE